MHGLFPATSAATSAATSTSAYDVPLPTSVEHLLCQICAEQNQLPACRKARQALSLLGEEAAVDLLGTISRCTIKRSLSAFILYLADKPKQARCSAYSSPLPSPSPSCGHCGARVFSSSPPSHEMSPPSGSFRGQCKGPFWLSLLHSCLPCLAMASALTKKKKKQKKKASFPGKKVKLSITSSVQQQNQLKKTTRFPCNFLSSPFKKRRVFFFGVKKKKKKERKKRGEENRIRNSRNSTAKHPKRHVSSFSPFFFSLLHPQPR